MIHILKRSWPSLLASLVLLFAIEEIFFVSTGMTRGKLIYALDDPYIHMAIAKNFSQFGVWGVTMYEFSSSSSSLLWTFILSVFYRVFGVNDLTPFVLNIISAIAVVFFIFSIFEDNKLPRLYSFLAIITVLFLAPVPSLVFAGMEHILQILITIIYAYLASKLILEPIDSKYRSKTFFALIMMSPIISTVRYEGLFLVAVTAALLIFRKKLQVSFLLVTLSMIPVVIYGVVSVKLGSFWLPNSIILKGSAPDVSSIETITSFISNRIGHMLDPFVIHATFLIVFAMVHLIIRYKKEDRIWTCGQVMTVIFIASAVLHLIFASTGWFYRYEAYIIVLGIVSLAISQWEFWSDERPANMISNNYMHFIIAALAIILFIPLIQRGYEALKIVPLASKNIFEQQYQMGLFLSNFYQGQQVAANDVGAINYLSNIRNLDLYGLASIEVAKAKRAGTYSTSEIYNLAKDKDVKIAIVYDHWFNSFGGLPSQWVRVGRWAITDNVICGEPVVSFYAVDSSEAKALAQNLAKFSPYLPYGVIKEIRGHTKY